VGIQKVAFGLEKL